MFSFTKIIFPIVLILFLSVGCDSDEKEKVYYSEIKTERKFKSKESKEVPIVKPEVDKSMLLTEEESLIVAKRYLNRYLIENYDLAGRTTFSSKSKNEYSRGWSRKSNSRIKDSLYGFVDGKYYFLLIGFSTGDRCWSDYLWHVTVDPLVGEGVYVDVFGEPGCN